VRSAETVISRREPGGELTITSLTVVNAADVPA
jgi:hypothetical protein